MYISIKFCICLLIQDQGYLISDQLCELSRQCLFHINHRGILCGWQIVYVTLSKLSIDKCSFQTDTIYKYFQTLELKYEMRFTQVSNYHTFHCITNALTKAFHPSIKKEQVALINQYRSCGLCKQWTKTYYISHQTVVALSSSWISDWHKYHTFSRRNTLVSFTDLHV